MYEYIYIYIRYIPEVVHAVVAHITLPRRQAIGPSLVYESRGRGLPGIRGNTGRYAQTIIVPSNTHEGV